VATARTTLVRLSLVLGAAITWAGAAAAQVRPRPVPPKIPNEPRVIPPSLTGSCFWIGPVTAKQFNVNFPDEATVYYYARFRVPDGARMLLRGRYPHARFASFDAYDVQGTLIDGLADVEIEPDTGSINPFAVGARRSAANRWFTIEVANRNEPANAAHDRRNVLYAGVPASGRQQIVYRVNVPDKGRDETGGVSLPRPEIVLASGAVLVGDATCAIVGAPEVGSEARAIRDVAITPDRYAALRDQAGAPATHPAQNPPQWEAYVNTELAQSRFLLNTPRAAERTNTDRSVGGAMFTGAAETQVSAYVDRTHGPVLVLTGTAPTTPRTFAGDSVMRAGQVRYWSLCQNESLASTAFVDCVYDEQVPLDAQGRYTIVMSLAADRPTNATAQCGVAWLDWGTRGDNVGRATAGLLVLRQLLAHPTFFNAAANVAAPGSEPRVMGAYLPTGRYTTKAEYESAGCGGAR
jgi:hypothetical protein